MQHALGFLDGPGQPWIDTKVFRPVSDAPIAVPQAVQALLAHPEYRDHYCSPENVSAGGELHGPYWADRILASDFIELSSSECESVLLTWSGRWGDDPSGEPTAKAHHVIEAALTLIHGAAHRRYLRDLRDEAEHDWGFVLGDFHEFVLLSPDGSINLVVASDD